MQISFLKFKVLFHETVSLFFYVYYMFSYNYSHITEHSALVSVGYDRNLSSHSVQQVFIDIHMPGSIKDTLTYVSEKYRKEP